MSSCASGRRNPATQFVPFDAVADYDQYVDGKPREDGVRSFLNSRGIELPEGSADDPPDAQTIHGLGNNKNERVLKLIHEQGVEVYEGSARYVRAVKEAGLPRAVVSSSTNTHDVLAVRRDRRPVRCGHRRCRSSARAPAWQTGARHVPGRRQGARRRAGACRGLRRRARRRRGRARRPVRLRRRRRPRRPTRRSEGARRGYRRG